MAYPRRLRFEAVREVAFGGIGVNYVAVGAAVTQPVRLFRLVNTTDQDVYFSVNGVTNHIRISSQSFLLLDITTNKVRDDGFFLDEGTVFYIKHCGVAPTSGTAWLEIIYAG